MLLCGDENILVPDFFSIHDNDYRVLSWIEIQSILGGFPYLTVFSPRLVTYILHVV